MATPLFDSSIVSAALTDYAGRPLLVAFSGGGDSTALLYALTQLDVTLRAVHVNHGLHTRSDRWARQCADICADWNVPLATVKVAVDAKTGQGIEAAARAVRYRALAECMAERECLLTAHTRDDQAETVLLQLLRGAGVKGLSGMAAEQPFAGGVLIRPLLDVARDDLRAYLHHHGIAWLDDPDNANLDRSRVFLRRRALPLLAERWPAATTMLARAAANLSEADKALSGYAQEDLARAVAGKCLRLDVLSSYAPARRRLVLRAWLTACGLPAPSRAHLDELESQLAAGDDAELCVTWPGAVVRRYRGRLYADAPAPRSKPPRAWRWESNAALELGHGLGCLSLETTNGAAPRFIFDVRLRRGGERIRIAGRRHTTEIKTLLQDMGVPPWQRDSVPLLFHNDEVAAVADWHLSEALAERLRQHGARLVWSNNLFDKSP